MRRIEHRDYDVARRVHREGGGEGGDVLGLGIAADARFFRSAGLAADTETRHVGILAGAVRHDQAEQLAHDLASTFGYHAAPLRFAPGLDLHQRCRPPDTSVDKRGIGARKVQRRNRNAMAIGHGHRGQPPPAPGPERMPPLAKLDIGGRVEPERSEKGFGLLCAKLIGKAGGCDVR